MDKGGTPSERSYLDEPERDGHPLLATIIGCVFLLLMLGTPARESRAAPADPAEAMGRLIGEILGGAIAGTAIVWGIAYAITIRHAPRRWKIGSLIAIALVASLVSVARVGARRGLSADDAREAAAQMEQVLNRNGDLSGPLRPGEGPLSRMQAAALNSMLADSQAFQREAAEAGLERAVDLDHITRADPVLAHCDRVEALAGRARQFGSRMPTHLAAARAVAEEHVARGDLSAADRDGFFRGAEQHSAGYERQWSLSAQIAEEAGAVCRLLAGGRWTRQSSGVTFANGRDADEVNAHIRRIQSLSAEQERIREASRQDARRTIEEMRR